MKSDRSSQIRIWIGKPDLRYGSATTPPIHRIQPRDNSSLLPEVPMILWRRISNFLTCMSDDLTRKSSCRRRLMKFQATFIASFCFLGIVASPVSAQQPSTDALYLDPKLPVEQRVDDLISRMTLEEKA